MTKGERKKAVVLVLARIEELGKLCDEAYEALREIEAKYFEHKATYNEVRIAETKAEDYKKEYLCAKLEYSELTKYKAWKA